MAPPLSRPCRKVPAWFAVTVSIAGLAACGEAPEPAAPTETGAAPAVEAPALAEAPPAAGEPTARRALFGAVHVHTNNSFDAFTNGTVSTPADAYKWARGEAIQGDKAGKMFRIKTPLDFYAVSDNAEMMCTFAQMLDPASPLSKHPMAERMRNEPVYEITQVKGTSETHPELSPNDEFAGFELWDYTLSADFERPTHRAGSYVRRALLDGLGFAQQGIGNPFQYGFIGDSDTHNAAASNEEFNYTGKFAFESEPSHRLLGLEGQPHGQLRQVQEFSSAGLAGVWAEANTRESIYDAIARRETFATSGPHIQVRMFGGFGLTAAADSDWVAAGYAGGVPMGGELASAAAGAAPSFILWAVKDPNSGNLDRLQIVKGWVDAAGQQHEATYDVAWSDGRVRGADGKLPAVGDTVDAATATYANSIGDAELFAVWTDPEFDAAQHAFYYLRAIEIQTPRWSTYDAVTLGVEIPAGLSASIQERAWGSPI